LWHLALRAGAVTKAVYEPWGRRENDNLIEGWLPCTGADGDEYAHTGYELSEKAAEGGLLLNAWNGMFDRRMFEFMGKRGQERVVAVMLALGRKRMPNDISEIIVGFVIGMENKVKDYFV